MAKQLLLQISIKKHLKSICLSVSSCYFEADDKKEAHKQKHGACYHEPQ